MGNNIVFVYGALIFLMTLIGGLVPVLFRNISNIALKLLVSLGAGVLIGMALVHMIPEAAELLPHWFGFWVLVGFLVLMILERFVMVHSCEEHDCSYHSIGIAAFLGLSVHGIIEGVALASSLIAAPSLGPLIFAAILFHKFPSGITLAAILRMAHSSEKKIAAFAIGLALSGPLGMALGYGFLVSSEMKAATGALLALSAGTFLYIAACDLIPEIQSHSTSRVSHLLMFLAGVGVCAASMGLPH